MIFHPQLIHPGRKSIIWSNDESLAGLRLFYHYWTEPKQVYPIRGINQSQSSDSTNPHNLITKICRDCNATGYLCNKCGNEIKHFLDLMGLNVNDYDNGDLIRGGLKKYNG